MLFSCKINQMFSLKSTTVMVTGHADNHINHMSCFFLMDSNFENRDNNKRFLGSQWKTCFFFFFHF